MAAPKKRRIPVNIDMTPMVDIGFLLLIFFMSTTVFKKAEEVAVQTPSSHSIIPLPETGVIVITIPKDNRIFMTLDVAKLDVDNGLAVLEGHTVKSKEFKAEQVADVIEQLVTRVNIDKVVIKADKEAEYGTIESVITTLQKNDLNIVNLVTEVEEG